MIAGCSQLGEEDNLTQGFFMMQAEIVSNWLIILVYF